jgi:uncharacterized protein YqeY
MPDSPLKTRIQEEMKQAMRAKDKLRLAVIRFLLAAVKKQEIDTKNTLKDIEILGIIQKLIKQYRETLILYRQSAREDLIEQQQFEIDVLSEYLPPQMSDDKIEALITETIATLKATSMQEMGKVMAILKDSLQGQADMSQVSKKVRERLSAI